MQKVKLFIFNIILLLALLLLVEATLWILFPNYKYYYRTNLEQANLSEILAQSDTSWLQPNEQLGWVCKQMTSLGFPSPPVEGVIYRINQQGFRNSFDFDDSLASHKKRVLLLGDSFMFNIYLSEKETVSSLLQEAKGEDYLFFNIAVPAWGLDQMYLAYQQYVDSIKPDQTIVAFVDDDLMRSLEILYHGCGRKPCLKIENEQLVSNEDSPHLWEHLCWNNQTGNRLLRIYYQQKAATLGRFMLEKIIDHEKAAGRTPTFIRIPALVDLQHKVPRKVFSMTDFMQTQDVPYVELYDTLAPLPPPGFSVYYIPDDGHFTKEGAEFLTKYILKWVE